MLETSGVAFVASPVRVEGREQRLEFPPALDQDGERIREEFGLPTPDSRPPTPN